MTTPRPAPSTRSHRRAAVALLATLGVLLAACSSSGDSASGDATTTRPEATTTTTEAGPPPELPEGREIDVQVPASYEKGTPAPLLVLLHGFGATGVLQGAYLHLPQAADEAGMLYVAPDGLENMIGKTSWNATDACCSGPKSETDDSAYLLDVIDTVKAQYDVDPNQVFVMGHSNGGFMSFRMACDHADVIAAIASLEGATFVDPADCAPSDPVSVLAIHGTADETISYDGGTLIGADYPSATASAEMWAGYDGCDDRPISPAPPDREIEQDRPPATVTAYGDCDDDTAVELWTQPDGTHIPSWTDDFSTQVVDWLLAHPKS